MTSRRVAAVQLGPSSIDLDANRDEVTGWVTTAAAAGAQLVVLPELALTPYFGSLPGGRYRQWASAIGSGDAAFLVDLASMAAVTLVAPFFEFDPTSGHFHNSALVAGANGVIPAIDHSGRVTLADRKLHLPVGDDPPCDEPSHFEPGAALGVHRIDVDDLALGCLICYDRRFPECWRELRALGADIVAVPVAGSGGDPDGYFVAELRTHARENGVIVIAANKVGTELIDGVTSDNTGESCVIDAAGNVVAIRPVADGPGLVVADLDLDSVAAARRQHRSFDHRRIDLFGGPTPAGVQRIQGFEGVEV